MPVVPQLPGRKNCKLQNANFKFAICILQFAISFPVAPCTGVEPVSPDRQSGRHHRQRHRADFGDIQRRDKQPACPCCNQDKQAACPYALGQQER